MVDYKELTINTNKLGEFWLPKVRKGAAAMKVMDFVCWKEAGRKNGPRANIYDAYNMARCALMVDHWREVEVVRQSGGLLLIGGAAC